MNDLPTTPSFNGWGSEVWCDFDHLADRGDTAVSTDALIAVLVDGALLAGFFLGGAESPRVRVRLRSMPAPAMPVVRR